MPSDLSLTPVFRKCILSILDFLFVDIALCE
jgi:hypothetical protein